MQVFLIIAGIVVVLAAIVGAILRTPTVKGKIGEAKVRRKIGKTTENVKYVLNDVLIDTEQRSSQIDHIVINANGVYVIETKNYSGRIYGKDNQQQWTQVLQYGKVKNKFYSPVKQNNTHIYEIKKIIGDDIPVKSIVVFVQNNTAYIESSYVYRISDLKSVLKKPITSKTLTIAEMTKINDAIIYAQDKCTVTNRQHIENIKAMSRDIDNNICPRCGKPLVERTSKSGNTFWGCSGYPKCKFTKKK